jgi:hypothetical protein
MPANYFMSFNKKPNALLLKQRVKYVVAMFEIWVRECSDSCIAEVFLEENIVDMFPRLDSESINNR